MLALKDVEAEHTVAASAHADRHGGARAPNNGDDHYPTATTVVTWLSLDTPHARLFHP